MSKTHKKFKICLFKIVMAHFISYLLQIQWPGVKRTQQLMYCVTAKLKCAESVAADREKLRAALEHQQLCDHVTSWYKVIKPPPLQTKSSHHGHVQCAAGKAAENLHFERRFHKDKHTRNQWILSRLVWWQNFIHVIVLYCKRKIMVLLFLRPILYGPFKFGSLNGSPRCFFRLHIIRAVKTPAVYLLSDGRCTLIHPWKEGETAVFCL